MNSKNLDLPKAKIQINRNTSLIIGILFFFLGIFDFCLNNFLVQILPLSYLGLLTFLLP